MGLFFRCRSLLEFWVDGDDFCSNVDSDIFMPGLFYGRVIWWIWQRWLFWLLFLPFFICLRGVKLRQRPCYFVWYSLLPYLLIIGSTKLRKAPH